jgi:iron complex outermembrane receptor protein
MERSRSTNSTLTAFIRGVGQQDPVAGFEGGVGIYIDDVYLNRPQGAVLDVYDVERIEVLRGPQGTLYGRNTIGGAVKYVTRRLSAEPEAKIKLTGGSYGQADLIASFGLPVSDTLRVGGAVARLTRSGFGDNRVQDGVDNYNKDVKAARASLEWLPSPELFVRIAGDWTVDDSDARNGHRLLDAQFSGNFPKLNDVFDTRANLDVPDPEVVTRGLSMHVEYTPSANWTVKNILAYRDNHSDQQIDFDSLPVVDLEAPYSLEDDQLSEEFQLLYTGDGVDALLGAYYLDATAFNEFDVLLGLTGDLIGLPGLNAYTLGEVDTKSWAVFSDVTLNLGRLGGEAFEDFDLSIGGRYTSDEREARILRQTMLGKSAAFGGPNTVIATTSDFDGDETFTEFTPRVSLAWQPTPEQNLYLSWSEGFKGGGFDPRGATTAAPDLDNDGTVSDGEVQNFMQFDPETISTWEIGMKSDWLGGRVNTRLALFTSEYTDVQIPGSIGVDSDNDGVADSFAGVTTNAGEASFDGVEFEGSALMAQNLAASGDALSATWSLGYIDAEFEEFVSAVTDPNTGQTSLEDVSDERNIQNTPEWTGNLALDYGFPLALLNRDGELSLMSSLSYRDDTSQFEFASPIDQPSYWLWDAGLVWESADGMLRAGLHGRNLTDEEYKVSGYDFVNIASPLGLEGTLTAFYGNPRTVSASVEVRF